MVIGLGIWNEDEIRESLDEIFREETVPSPSEQIQQAGMDLTLRRVLKIPTDFGEIPFGEGGWVDLSPHQSYWLEFNELSRQEYHTVFLPNGRSTVFRMGGAFYAYQMDALDGECLGAQVSVVNDYGISLQKDARVAQFVVMDMMSGFGDFSVSEKMTVEKIFLFRKAGRLGVTERDTDVAEEVSGPVQILPDHGCLIRFKEVVNIQPDEVAVSLSDRVAEGVVVTGAVADPGYSGKLGGCLRNNHMWPFEIKVGMKLLQLRRWKIKPVAGDKLYNGAYQGTGLDETQSEETLRWFPFAHGG